MKTPLPRFDQQRSNFRRVRPLGWRPLVFFLSGETISIPSRICCVSHGRPRDHPPVAAWYTGPGGTRNPAGAASLLPNILTFAAACRSESPSFAIFLNDCSHHSRGGGEAECGASSEGWRERPALR